MSRSASFDKLRMRSICGWHMERLIVVAHTNLLILSLSKDARTLVRDPFMQRPVGKLAMTGSGQFQEPLV
jgi:hypothetical protein